MALSIGAWADFIAFAVGNYSTASPVPVIAIPLLVRIPMALGSSPGRPDESSWTVPVAAGWSALALYEWSYIVVWAAAIPLYVASRAASPARDDASTARDIVERPTTASSCQLDPYQRPGARRHRRR